MIVHRAVHIPGSTTRIPRDATDDPRLTFRALGVLSGICYLEQHGHPVTIAELLKHGTEGRDAISTALRLLVKCGYIEMPDDLPPARGKLDPLLWAQVVVRDKCKCRYCGKRIKSNVHIDHVDPLRWGGRDELGNLVVACRTCNLKKHDRTPEEAGMPLLEVPVD